MYKREMDKTEIENYYQITIYNEIFKRLSVHVDVYENGEGTATILFDGKTLTGSNFPCTYDPNTIAFNLIVSATGDQHVDILSQLKSGLTSFKGNYRVFAKGEGYEIYDMETRKTVFIDRKAVIKYGTVNALLRAIIELKQC